MADGAPAPGELASKLSKRRLKAAVSPHLPERPQAPQPESQPQQGRTAGPRRSARAPKPKASDAAATARPAKGRPPAAPRAPAAAAATGAAAAAAAAAAVGAAGQADSGPVNSLDDAPSAAAAVPANTRKRATRRAPTAAAAAAAAADSDSDSLDGGDDDEEDEEEWTDEEAAQPKRSRVESKPRSRKWTQKEIEDLADRPLSHQRNTASQYTTIINVFRWWCRHDPQTGRKRQQPVRFELEEGAGPADAARFLSWYILQQRAGYPRAKKTPYKSKSILSSVHSALQAHYRACLLQHAVRSGGKTRSLMEDMGYKEVYGRCQAHFKLAVRSNLPAEMDPLSGTQDTTFTTDQFVTICKTHLDSSDPKVVRDLSHLIAMSLMCGRGDDMRGLQLRNLMSPILRTCIGPVQCILVGVVQLDGKNLGSCKVVRAALRAADPAVDSQGAMGRMFVSRWTTSKERLQAPDDPNFGNVALFADKAGAEITYHTHYMRTKGMFSAAGVNVEKVTHAARVFAAQLADAAGLPDEVIKRLGLWNLDACQSHYLMTTLMPDGLLAMGFWPEQA